MTSFKQGFQREYDEAMAESWRKVARDVVDDLRVVLAEPELDSRPSDLQRFGWLDARWYRETTRLLEGKGFRLLRDLDATPLTGKHARPSLIRVLLSGDGRTSAALYHVRPKAPNVLWWLLLKLLGKWPKDQRVVELMSYPEGGVVATLSAEQPFSVAPGSSRVSLPCGTSLEDLLAHHAAHVADKGTLRTFTDFDALDAARNEQRARTRRWRDEVGLLPEELDALLVSHGENGVKVRPYVVEELRRRREERR